MRNCLPAAAFGFLSLVLVLGAATPGSSAVVASEAPVAEAAMRGDLDTVRTLLRDGADVNAALGDGTTALHWAALNDDAELARVLLYAGANLEPITRLGAYTPLHLASREGSAAVVSALIEAGADLARYTDTGVLPLHLAAESGNAEAVATLLAQGADVDARDEGAERTPLMFATASNRLGAMRVLLDAGADVSLETRIIDYVEIQREDQAEQRIRNRILDAAKPEPERPAAGGPQRGQQGQQQGQQGQQGQQQGRQGQQQAQTPPDPDPPPARGQAGARGQQAQRDPDDPPAGGRRGGVAQPAEPTEPASAGNTASTPDPIVPRDLSDAEQIGRQGGFTAMHFAARDGHFDAAMMLLESGTDINDRTGGDESTPMVVAVINGNFDLALDLLERGADPNMVSEDGVGALFAVLNNEWQLRTWYPQPTAGQQQETGYLDLMRALLDAGADPNQRVNQHIWYAAYNAVRMGVEFAGATPFWRAAYAADVAAMRMLVEYGADPNIPTMQLSSGRRRFGDDDDEEREGDPSGLPPVPPGGPHVHPLHAATGVGFGTSRVGQQHRHVPDGWLPAVKYLVGELGVDVNVRDADGYSAVHNAAGRGDNPVIEYLVEHGADVTVVSRRGQTTVDMANGPQQRVQPFPETMALLESLGAINNHNCISC